MKELVVENLHKSYGIKNLLSGVDFAIRDGDRVGLIGPNGTGKSSFLKVLAGQDTYDQGEISQPNKYTIAYLAQNPQFNPNQTILQAVYQSDHPLIQLNLAYQEAVEALQADPENPALFKQFNALTDQMTLQNAWDVDVRAKTILNQLGLTQLNRKLQGLSGGEFKRVGLAQVLISEPDLLILDEPTNHLDIPAIEWLEKYLADYKGALLLVTHDRYFLDRVVNKIVELRHGHFREYSGTYQDYLTKRTEQQEIQHKLYEKQNKLYQQELAWMRTGARARTTKQQARIDRFQDLAQDIKDRPQDQAGIAFEFDQQRIGKQIIEMEDVSISVAAKPVINHFTKTFIKGDCLGIIGPNGIGKTSFLNALAGFLPVDHGRIEMGQTVRLAYYRQMDEDLPADQRILTYLSRVADHFKRPDGSMVSASSMLERFNFPRESHGSLIGQLSGGERRRLYLLSLLIQEPNVLLLDEPTNDLDIDTLTVLEDYLSDFAGVVIIVSHDRYFLDKIVNQVLCLQGSGSYQLAYGNYSDYHDSRLATKSNQLKEEPTSPAKDQTIKEGKSKSGLTYLEKKEWASIEEEIERYDLLIQSLEDKMNAHGSDLDKLLDWQQELDQANEMLLHLYERYDYLSDKV